MIKFFSKNKYTLILKLFMSMNSSSESITLVEKNLRLKLNRDSLEESCPISNVINIVNNNNTNFNLVMDNLNFLQEKTEKVIKTSVDCYTQTLNSVVSTAVNTEEIQVLSNTVRNINIQNRTNQYYSTREIASRILNYSKNVTQKFRETNRVHVEEHENLID